MKKFAQGRRTAREEVLIGSLHLCSLGSTPRSMLHRKGPRDAVRIPREYKLVCVCVCVCVHTLREGIRPNT